MQTLKECWTLLKEAVAEFVKDNAISHGAAISFYAMTAMGPVLYVCAWLAGLVYGSHSAQMRLIYDVRRLVGGDTAGMLQAVMEAPAKFYTGFWPAFLGTLVLVFTAGGVFIEVQMALNSIWKTPDPPFSFWRMLRNWLQSIALVAGIGVLFCSSLFISTLVRLFGRYFEGLFGIGSTVVWIGNFAFSAVLICLLFAVIYQLLPNRELHWRDVLVGAAITTVLILVGEYLIALYLAMSALGHRYGVAGGAIAILLWLYYSVQVFLFGAELTKAWARRYGSLAARAVGRV